MKSLQIINFKALRNATFDLKPLTVLSGLNDSGKSCVLQSLLLLQQSYQQGFLPEQGLALNGDLVSIGNSTDALNRYSRSSTIEISFIAKDSLTRSQWRFDASGEDTVLPLVSSPVPNNVFPTDFHYLTSCGRAAPIDYTPVIRATRDSFILLEHPEHRLHGSLASSLGLTIAKGVSQGAQIVVETHSDHLFNGIRLAVHKGLISAEDVTFLHFQAVDYADRREIEIQTRSINRHGRIARWPLGFFDEWDNALEKLLEPANI
jgi:predicted ATPase